MKKPFLQAEWNNLIMMNYVIDPALLLPYLPAHTELDIYKGNVYVSVIGFMFEEVKLLGFKIPFHVNFEEVNLRFYVRHLHNGQWKRGAVFIKEIVPKYAITFVANNLYREKYSCMPMKHSLTKNDDSLFISYGWKYKNKWNRLEATVGVNTVPMEQGSEEQFIAEHYWGYSKFDNNTTFEYEVLHPSWQVYPVKDYALDCDFEKLYGKSFAFLAEQKPSSVFVAKGSGISIMNKRRL
ncbi:MAG: DUF2071 domain-containing protein [Ferruginibacter sp.]